MSRVKELFIEQHERLIGEYLDAHPEADEAEAYEATGESAHNALRDYYADMADYLNDRDR